MAEYQVISAKEEMRFFPFLGLFYYTRNSFFEAGQDSFTKPPAQDPDLFSTLTNVEPISDGVLHRRRGYTLWANPSISAPYIRGFLYQNFNSATRRVVLANSSRVDAFDENGTLVAGDIIVPTAGALPPWMVCSRSFGYFSDGLASDNRKWDGSSNSPSSWGIDIDNSTGNTYGPNLGSSEPLSTGWSNPGYLYATDGASFATNTTLGDPIQGTGFGFSIPGTPSITGIVVSGTVEIGGTGGGYPWDAWLGMQLIKNGVVVGNYLGQGWDTQGVARNFNFSVGSPTETWGVNWESSDINASNFGVQLNFTSSLSPFLLGVQNLQIAVYVAAPALSLGTPTSGNVTLNFGRRYFYTFLNSTTGGTSDLSPASNSTGVLSSKEVPLSNIPVSNDGQVDQKIILATADGGDETLLYFLAQIPNATTTYTDNTTEAVLLVNNVYQEIDAQGSLHGVFGNSPPPGLSYSIVHRGRIYGLSAQGNGEFLFFSKNLNDVMTSTGTITGHWEEAWPAANQMVISKDFELGRGLMSDGQVLYIGTERHILRLIGDSPSNYQTPEVVFSEAGILNQLVWQPIFLEDQPVGAVWLTPDFRVIASDFNTYSDIGTPIQDVLNSINPAAAQNAFAAYVNQAELDLYMLYVPTGSNTYCDTVCVFNIRTKKWFIWQPADQASCALFDINLGGKPLWLFGSGNGSGFPVYKWDSTVKQDRTGNTPISYPVTATTSFLNLGDLTVRKSLNTAVILTDDTSLQVSVSGAITRSDMATPFTIVSNATVTLDPLGNYFIPLAATPKPANWYQLQFTSPTSTADIVLAGVDLEAVPLLRL